MKEQLDITKEKMSKSLNSLGNELASIRAGRANPAILDKVMVDYYGAPTPINQMAAISVAEARILVIQPWDATALSAPNSIPPIERIPLPQPISKSLSPF